jgi:hypothetical protein
MNIVYIVLAHHYPEQLIRLLYRLNKTQSTILVHLDRKMDENCVRQIKKSTDSSSNIHYLPRSFCIWGDFGMVQAANDAIRTIIDDQIPCDYACLLSGQDYPIKPHTELVSFLSAHLGHSFLEYFPLPSENWTNGGINRYEEWHFSLPILSGFPKLRNKLCRVSRRIFNHLLPKRKMPYRLIPYGGSSWWCLAYPSLKYINDYNHDYKYFSEFFKHALSPDELFYQTILLNSPLSSTIIGHNLTYADWQRGSPKILGTEDIDRIKQSNMFFARKIDINTDSNILDALDNL